MSEAKRKFIKTLRRKGRIRNKIRGNGRARLSLFRSNKYMYAQIIDDVNGVTMLGVSEKELKDSKGTPVQRAGELGKLLAEKAKGKKVAEVVFDKGSYKYHGRVKAFADGAREGGLKF